MTPQQKIDARMAVMIAVRSGNLVKPHSCSECGKTGCRIEAHHPDYSRPMEIEWLCKQCHNRRHPGEGGRPRLLQTEDSLVYLGARVKRKHSAWLKSNGGAAKLRELIDDAMTPA